MTLMDIRALRAAVQSVVNGVDPEGLLRMGAPINEYDPEIDDFVGAIARDVPITEDFVRETWARWFDPRAGERTCLVELTGRLMAVQRDWRGSR
jgi:hypothetical protein